MKTYIVKFQGHYPVGACAIVVAGNKGAARGLLLRELEKTEGVSLAAKNRNDPKAMEFEEIDVSHRGCKVIFNGDY